MFEIYGRHTPMFRAAKVKTLLDLFCAQFEIDSRAASAKLELLPPHQSVRINEINPIILRRTTVSEATDVLFDTLPENDATFQSFVSSLGDSLLLDSYKAVDERKLPEWINHSASEKNTKGEQPLLVGSAEDFNYDHVLNNTPRSQDLPFLFRGREINSSVKFAEAYFAVEPRFVLEVGLNRFQALGALGDFLVGMIRL